MRSKTTRKRETTETKTPGKRKILPSTGQETSYLALFGVAVATMSLVWYKKKGRVTNGFKERSKKESLAPFFSPKIQDR